MDMYSKVLLSLFLVNGLLVIAGSLKAAIDARKQLNEVLALSVENKKDGFAYSQALAFESLELREKFNQDKQEFNGVTFDDIEKYAKTVAYKVAHNLSNGFVMDKNDDPLIYD